MHILFVYVLTLPVFIALDLLWLGFVAKDFYQSRLDHLLGPVNWIAASCFYVLYVAGIFYFAVSPALSTGSLGKALMLGALVGLFAYGTYDLTNHATLRDWPLSVTIVDMIWGSVLGGIVASVGYLIGKALM